MGITINSDQVIVVLGNKIAQMVGSPAIGNFIANHFGAFLFLVAALVVVGLALLMRKFRIKGLINAGISLAISGFVVFKLVGLAYQSVVPEMTGNFVLLDFAGMIFKW